jgi:hypothetical protein
MVGYNAATKTSYAIPAEWRNAISEFEKRTFSAE